MMKALPVFTRYLSLLCGILLVSSFYLPGRYGIPYPQSPAPQFKPGVNRDFINAIAADKPELVLVGDSVLYLGVAPDQLSKILGLHTYSMGVPGSGSAVWYLLLKNVILDSSPRPGGVVILFRDTMLTVPEYRTTGAYFGIVDDFAGRREPLVTQLAFIGQMNPVEKLAEQYLPIYNARWRIREGWDSRIRYAIPSVLFDCPAGCTDDAFNSVFGKDRMDQVAMNQAVEDAGATLYSPKAMNFDGAINRSFLPAMIQLAKENDLALIFVRTRTLNFPATAYEPPALREYIKSLREYLFAQQDIFFLDFAEDARLKDEYFLDSLHFNAAGKQAFTKILAEELRPLLK